MSTYSGHSGVANSAFAQPTTTTTTTTYHPIKGFSYPNGTSNPLTSLTNMTHNKTRSATVQTDPYLARQDKLSSLLRNPSLRHGDDGSLTYDPNYDPKHHPLLYMAAYDTREDMLEPVEPLFWFLCAVVIGLSCFVAFLTCAILQLPFTFMKGTCVYIASGSCGFFLFVLTFLFYVFASEEDGVGKKIIDGVIGAFPYLILGGLVGYMYSGYILLMILLHNEGLSSHRYWWYMTYSSVPVFLFLFLFLFIMSVMVLESSALTARIFKGLPLPPAGFIPRYNPIASYIFAAIRRFIVGFVLAVGLSAYYTIPCFGLGWAAYGLYESTDIKWWLPLVIVLPFILFLFLFLFLLGPYLFGRGFLFTCAQPWIGPFHGWARVPLRSTYFPRYYCGKTIRYFIEKANAAARKGNAAHVKGQAKLAEEYYQERDEYKAEIIERGIEIHEKEDRSWRSTRVQQKAGMKSKWNLKKKNELEA